MPSPPFAENRVAILPLLDLLDWAAGADPANQLYMPVIQRDSVWNPPRILGLWRSVMAGMPIGALYLSPVTRSAHSFGSQDVPGGLERKGFDLLDGQQRLRTLRIALRTPAEEQRCLWADAETGELRLLVTTAAQPFGYDREGNKLGVSARRDARLALMGVAESVLPDGSDNSRPYDHELFGILVENDPNGWPPRPALASGALPLHALFQAWRNAGGAESGLLDWIQRQSKQPLQPTVLAKALHHGFSRMAKLQVPLILAVAPDDVDEADWILQLFRGIGAAGVPLSAADQLFAIYKRHNPTIRDVVDGIHTQIGRIMAPTAIVQIALRIAAAMQKTDSPSFTVPDPTAFSKAMSNITALRDALEGLIGEGRFARAFAAVTRAITYEPGSHDIGIPKQMLVMLQPELFAVLVLHALLRQGVTLDRAGMTRFALFWHFCVDAAYRERAVQRAFRCLIGLGANDSFPGAALYKDLTRENEGEAYILVPADDVETYAQAWRLPQTTSPPAPKKWRGAKEHLRIPDTRDPTGQLILRWTFADRMLLWLQRRYIATTFASYDPAAGRDDDTPYDLDHIQPRAMWQRAYRMMKCEIPDTWDKNSVERNRDHLGEAIGNKRWIDFPTNRSDGASSLEPKLATVGSWGIGAFDMSDANRALWTRAAVDGTGWSDNQLTAFQDAVEARTLWLYRQFWDEGGLQVLLSEASMVT
jgi:hypothetical protein